MNNPLKALLAATALAGSLSTFSLPTYANITQQQSSVILSTFSETSFTDFREFLRRLGTSSLAVSQTLAPAINAFLDAKDLTNEQQNQLHRLLGLYARLKYRDAAIDTLGELVAIPTFRVEGVAQHENPEFLRFAYTLERIARSFNLTFRNVDNRVYEISLGDSGNEVVGIHAHADVVPANPEDWVLEDGTRLDPFQVTQVGNRLYGRGTEDDKNGIVVALYAMKVIKEEQLPQVRSFKLLVDTTEEIAGDAIAYYFSRNPTPNYNIALDGGYPVVIAEKGYGTLVTHFPRRDAQGKGAEITSVTGGLAANQIPRTAVATFADDNPAQLAAVLQKTGADYAKGNGGDFEVTAEVVGKDIKLTVTGVAAHSSEPESGVNPVARILGLIHELAGKIALKRNHITDAARYATDNWGLDYLGNKLGIGFTDAFMGPLTTSLTYIGMDERAFTVTVNLRVPKGRATEILKTDIDEKLQAWSQQTGVAMTIDCSIAEPMHRNPEGEWVKALLAVATENLGMEPKFGASAAATSVHDLPNGVQFGLARLDTKYTGHTNGEFKTVDQFLLDLQNVTEMMGRIGQMPKL